LKGTGLTSRGFLRKRITSRLAGAGGAARATVGSALLGPELRRHVARLPRLDPAHEGLRIAHLSDLHLGHLTRERRLQRAARRAREARPDLVVLTGDYVCWRPSEVVRLVDALAPLRDCEVRVLATLGNHDHWTDGAGVRRALEALGVHVLENAHLTLTIRGAPLHVIGVDDHTTGRADVTAAFRGVPAGGTRLTLAHNPESAEECSRWGADLVLSGHTHGMQVVLPRLTDRIAARIGIRYVSGFFSVNDSLLYVTTNMESWLPVRAGAPAEVALLRLERGALGGDLDTPH
jgi:predicted MPP superfamily phosphohydrolase